jgi:Glu-tRNA(Gln) amidotransferase subunit E-like FAD-binding protein
MQEQIIDKQKIDYLKVGFKAGLEIHQQLDSHKLFCNCPSVLRSDTPDLEFHRRLHAVAGESGKVDVAASYEAGLDKEFVYQFYKDNDCLVDIDEEPPKKINDEALGIAIQIALVLNCKVNSISQIMRKTVLDGSNTSGFQRTVLIGYDGFVETSLGKVGVSHVFLEEDSARPVSRDEKKVVYKLDRLGIPLVEIATNADIKNAEHAKETALKIGEILRTCKVKRGIGTIRQDINISIKNSSRVELKGFQDPKIMIKTVDNEILRQLELVKGGKRTPSEVRNVLADGTSEFMRPMPGASRMYPETDLPLLKISRDIINEVKKNKPKAKAEIEEELKEEGLNQEFIKLLLESGKVEAYKELLNIIKNPGLIVKTLLIFPKEIASKNKMELKKVEQLLDDRIPDVLNLVKSGKILESQVKDIFESIVKGGSYEDLISNTKNVGGDNVEEQIMKLIKAKPGLSANAYMGLVMKELRGKVDGKTAMELIGKYL